MIARLLTASSKGHWRFLDFRDFGSESGRDDGLASS